MWQEVSSVALWLVQLISQIPTTGRTATSETQCMWILQIPEKGCKPRYITSSTTWAYNLNISISLPNYTNQLKCWKHKQYRWWSVSFWVILILAWLIQHTSNGGKKLDNFHFLLLFPHLLSLFQFSLSLQSILKNVEQVLIIKSPKNGSSWAFLGLFLWH